MIGKRRRADGQTGGQTGGRADGRADGRTIIQLKHYSDREQLRAHGVTVSMTGNVRIDIYTHGDARVDLKAHPRDWFAVIRVWDGARWPKVVRTWRARMRRWVPWFSLEHQAVRAVEFANRLASVHVPREVIRKRVQSTLKAL